MDNDQQNPLLPQFPIPGDDDTDRAATLRREAEALGAISAAMAALPRDSAQRIAEWAKSLAGSTEHQSYLHSLETTNQVLKAVLDHYEQNRNPSKADAALYLSVFDHDKLRREVLVAFYAED